MSFRRRLMMAQRSGGLPYDAEVEYLESNGTPYIDSGIECTGDLAVEFEGMHLTTANTAVMGAIKQTSQGYFRHHYTPQQGCSYWIQNNSIGTASVRVLTDTTNQWNKIKIDPVNGTAEVNSDTRSFTPLSAALTTECNYGVFARLGSFQSKKFRLKYLKLSKGGMLLRDFIPVRVGTTGYLYDKVSGQLFGNVAGSGTFTYGNDVN